MNAYFMSDPNINKFCLVLSNFPDQESALKVAEMLLEQKLAACVNVLQACTSVYQWQGKLVREQESVMMIKTRSELFGQLEAVLLQQHPYELPEIIQVPIHNGHSAYLEWVSQQTQASPASC
jgi:periplasmic divalent cation tolerance protein